MLAFLVILFPALLTAQNAPSPTTESNRLVSKDNGRNLDSEKPEKGKQNKPTYTVTPGSIVSPLDSKPQKDERTAQSDERVRKVDVVALPPDRLYRLYVALTGMAVIIGLITAIAVWRQMKANELSATAAKKSADALMLGDRAWVLIKRTAIQDKIQDPYLPTAEQMMAEQRMPHCIFFLKNYGKTPAKITAWKYELQIGDNPNMLPDVTVYDMKNMPTFTPDMLPQGASVAQQADFRTMPGLQEFLEVKERRKFLWLCGTVRYVDTFERGQESEHETVFCYVWETRMNTPKPCWQPRGPAKYIRAT